MHLVSTRRETTKTIPSSALYLGHMNAKNGEKTYRSRPRDGWATSFRAHAPKGLEEIVGKDVDPLYSSVSVCQGQPPAPALETEHGGTVRTRWFVFKLSICFRNTKVHRSLHRNLITSNVSVKRGRSLENLSRKFPRRKPIVYFPWRSSAHNFSSSNPSPPCAPSHKN